MELLIVLRELGSAVAAAVLTVLTVLAVLAEFAAADRDEVDPVGEFTHLEAAALLRVSPVYASARMVLAETLTTRLPATLTALWEGRIDGYKAQRVASATEVRTDEQATRVEDELIPHAGAWNPQQLNSRLRRVITRVDPEGAAKRAEARRAARHVRHEVLDDGAGLLPVYGDGERTHLAHQRIQTIARELKQTSGDQRTVDQIAADVALDCLAGKDHHHAKVHVWFTIPASTALGVDEKPCHLAGFG